LMNFLVRFRKAQGREGEGGNQKNGQGTVQHRTLSGRNTRCVRLEYRPGPQRVSN
jgi:hypothetical protein